VVIAEDEVLIRMDLKEMLTEEGYHVVGEAGDGQEAIRLAEEHRPDLVILDVKMPVLDGIAAAEQIAKQRIAPVVMLTAFSQRDLVERARDAGAMAYLVKPFNITDLVPAIELAVSRFQELSQLEAEVLGLQERLETRKAIDRAGAAPAERARCVPVDPEDRHGPASLDAPGCGRRHRARSRPGLRAAAVRSLLRVSNDSLSALDRPVPGAEFALQSPRHHSWASSCPGETSRRIHVPYHQVGPLACRRGRGRRPLAVGLWLVG
jgi:response regulator NasT